MAIKRSLVRGFGPLGSKVGDICFLKHTLENGLRLNDGRKFGRLSFFPAVGVLNDAASRDERKCNCTQIPNSHQVIFIPVRSHSELFLNLFSLPYQFEYVFLIFCLTA